MWLQDILGSEASPVVQEPRAARWIARAEFRGVHLVAEGADGAAAESALRQKVERHADALRALEHIQAVQETNLVHQDADSLFSRRFLRLISRTRAELELALGIDGAMAYVDAEGGTIGVVSRDATGRFEHLRVGPPVHGDDQVARPLPVPGRTPAPAQEEALRADKAARVRSLLRCPVCRGALEGEWESLHCPSCARDFAGCDGRPVLPLREGYDPHPPAEKDVSMNPYGQQVLSLIEDYRDGWVLDCGSGSPSQGFYNVVHLDLFAYPNVDLVTDGRALPFADASFDAILSEAVLEHVEDPWAYMRELARVLKPGGLVRIDVAFLVPYHGYPDHYFNMSHSGLAQLVQQTGFDVESIDVGPHQHPQITLSLLLNGFVQGTADPDKRARLLAMDIDTAIQKLAAGGGDPLDGLDRGSVRKYAAGFGCLARRRRD